MDKIKEYLKKHPAIEVFGWFGIILVIILFFVTVIVQIEFENLYIRIFHKSNPSENIVNEIETETIEEYFSKDKFYSMKNVKIADMVLKIKDTQLTIMNEDGTPYTSLGIIITEQPNSLKLINLDFNVDCSEYILETDDNGNTLYIFENLIPGNYHFEYNIDGYVPKKTDLELDAGNIFDGCWNIGLIIKGMDVDTFYPAGINTINSNIDPNTGYNELISGVQYGVKVLESDYYLQLGETNALGKSEYFLSCPKNTKIFINLIYNDISTEFEILFNQESTALTFILQPDGTFLYNEFQ